MINDEAKNCYYLAVINLSELYSLRWLRSKKEAIINGDNCFQNALNDALNDQNIEKDKDKEYKKLSIILVSIIGKGQNSQLGQKTGKNLNKIIRQLLLIYYLYHIIQKTLGLHTDQNITTSMKIK